MLSEVQNRKIAKYRKLAKKNVFCRYLATILLVMNVVLVKFFSFHKRQITMVGELCLVFLVLFMNTSFAPPTFQVSDERIAEIHSGNDNVRESVVFQADVTNDAVDCKENLNDEHALIDTEEEVANLDDLIQKNGESLASKEDTQSSVRFEKDDWKLLLINKQHTIPEDYQFTLGVIKGSMRCDERIIDPLTQMFSAAKEDGVNLGVCSPYRDMERQEYLFERKIKNYQMSGMSYMEAYKQASFTVTVPGASEHQVGLAVDIISDTYTSLDVGFADTLAGKWLKEHSWEYGFILRYPEGKEQITGIQYEPWHFRYVGIDAAEAITSQNITLEEFIENL